MAQIMNMGRDYYRGVVCSVHEFALLLFPEVFFRKSNLRSWKTDQKFGLVFENDDGKFLVVVSRSFSPVNELDSLCLVNKSRTETIKV